MQLASKVFTAEKRIRRRLVTSSGGRSDRPLLQRTIYFVAFVHLALVGAVVFHGVDPWANQGWWQRPLGFWGGINYSLWRFGFFSPDVGRSSEVEFKVTHKDGTIEKFSTLESFRFFIKSHESVNRFYGFRTQSSENPVLQDLCARSVVVRLLNELGMSEDVNSVDYTVRTIRYPTMEAFRAGEGIATKEFYSTHFVMDQK
ncbi:MAG: hypothetical protein V7609_404 [Verrucomicrobiota bacterium]